MARWEDGAYCLYCILFGHKSTSYSRIKNFYLQPFRNWHVAVRSFKGHANTKSGMHSDSKILYYSFLGQYKVKIFRQIKWLTQIIKQMSKKPERQLLL